MTHTKSIFPFISSIKSFTSSNLFFHIHPFVFTSTTSALVEILSFLAWITLKSLCTSFSKSAFLIIFLLPQNSEWHFKQKLEYPAFLLQLSKWWIIGLKVQTPHGDLWVSRGVGCITLSCSSLPCIWPHGTSSCPSVVTKLFGFVWDIGSVEIILELDLSNQLLFGPGELRREAQGS